MSGFEVAGVVLGSIPILLAALKLGGDAVQSSRQLFGYKAVLYRYQTILEAEAATYKNTLIFLLDDVASATKLESLLEDPNSEIWRDQSFVQRLRDKRLGENYNAVLNVMKAMDKTLCEFREKIGADQATQTPKKRIVLKLIAYRSKLDELVDDLAGHNRRLESLTRMAVPLRAKAKAGNFLSRLSTFRTRALALHDAMKATLKCIGHHHETGLILENEDQSYVGPLHVLFSKGAVDWLSVAAELVTETICGTLSATVPISARTARKAKGKMVAFASPQIATSRAPSAPMQAIQVPLTAKHPSATAASASLESITDLCLRLSQLPAMATTEAFGKISAPPSSFRMTMSPLLLTGSQIAPPSLDNWLGGHCSTGLSFPEKMGLAVSISAAVVSLSATPWLPSYPRKEHILLLKSKPAVPARLCISVRSNSATLGVPASPPPRYIKEPTIFMLGILLLELIFEKPADKLHNLVKHHSCQQCSSWEELYNVADTLLDEGHVQIAGGPNYESAVKSCIRGELGVVGSNLDLQDMAVQQSVYQSVIAPLDENMLAFKLKPC